MKVSELKKGVLLECVNDSDSFFISPSHSPLNKSLKTCPWLSVRERRKSTPWQKNLERGPSRERLVIYLGTAKEANAILPWCDKFVLIGNQTVGVDPASWKRLRIVK